MLNPNAAGLLSDQDVIDRLFQHIDEGTTDLGTEQWKEPVSNYTSQARFDQEIALLRRRPIVFCPSAALPDIGSYIARTAAGTPLLVARGRDNTVRAFINACRHRGMQVANGEGCARSFSCPYHAWTYDLDGSLKGVPGAEGFPDLNLTANGLVEVAAWECGGLVYVMQDAQPGSPIPIPVYDFFTPDQVLFHQSQTEDSANWKLLTETLLEGYHIKSLHRESFFPYGFDNTNIVESFGENSRVIYPFKRIEKLRSAERDQRDISGMATLVYLLFPNVSIAVLSKHTSVTIIEPISPTETHMVSYHIKHRDTEDAVITLEDARRDLDFVNQSGQAEDREAARAIQETVTTRANSHLTFGYYEKAIVAFHQQLHHILSEQG